MRNIIGLLAIVILAACDGQPAAKGVGEKEPETASGVAKELLDQAPKEFTGGDHLDNTSTASYRLPVSVDEAKWLDDRDAAAFSRSAKKRFPDIAKVKFEPDAAMKDDAETAAMYRDNFYAGLYFAKQIKAADGRTLFDLMTKCGRLTDPASGADLGFAGMGDHKGTWVNIQYFPKFRRIENGEPTDLQLLFEREGDVIKARSQFFSSHALDQASFMRDHGIACF